MAELRCTICTAVIPEPRSHRNTAVCSEKCKNRLDTIRAQQRRNKRCNYCLHPSSEAERREFRRWRYERGDVKTAEAVPRDHEFAPKQELRRALQRALIHLQMLAPKDPQDLARRELPELERIAGVAKDDREENKTAA